MSSDYAEKEREFIDTLEADTGRDLAGWMAAISGAGLGHRNDIIDWLRRQRFTFDKASWIERIHHNGGRPIYAEKPDLKALAGEVREPPPAAEKPAPPPPTEKPAPRLPAAAAPPAAVARPSALPASPPTAEADLEALLARGKAFRPLAQHLLKAIDAVLPGAIVAPRGNLIALGAAGAPGAEFAVVVPSGKDVKLGLALGDAAARDGLEPARIPGAGPKVTHMVALTDVRRIDAALLAHVAAAHKLASGR